MMSKHIRICLLAAALPFASALLFSQPAAQIQSQPPAAVPSERPNLDQLNREAAHDVHQAAARYAEGRPVENTEEAEENAQFKYHALFRAFDERAVAAKTGLSKEAVYWIYMVINFAILAGALGWIIKKSMPNGFAPRTAEIQEGIEEARKASAEANARLSEIEHRLARLDTEIAAIRTAAEADFSIEEQRIKAAAELDARNVIAAAEQEINAATRVAQRELKSFVADLAVGLAEKKIKVDDATDQALVRTFAFQLGKDGQ